MRLAPTKHGLLTLALGTFALPCLTSPALADDACTLRGRTPMPKTASIYDAASGGQEIARFTGAKVDLTVASFPEAAGGRAGITTSGFRIKGFVRAKDIPVYTIRSVPMYAGHSWIADGRRVAVLGVSGGRLHVEKSLTFPLTGYFHGWASCDSFSLAERVPSGWTPPGSARGYLVKRARAELFADAKGADVVTAIEPAGDGPGVLLWSTDRAGGWIHVEHHGDVILDGWVRAEDVSALPPGETMDQLAPSSVVPGAPQLQVQGQSKVVHATGSVTLRAAASETGPVIGSIEPGVDVLVLDTVAGWASVVPKTLELAPAGTNQFWVRAKDLGL